MSTPRSPIERPTSASSAQRQAASYTAVHRSLLAGFCTMVGTRGEEGVYLGTRGVHFHIFPGSSLVRRRPRWVMAANIVETSRVFARRVAEIEPQWIEAAASHLLKREYLEPDWDEEREEVVARERISFLGLTLSANRVVNYGPIAPEESRRIFAREALVYQRLQRRPDWLLANDAAVREAQRMEERLRTRDLLQSAETFVEFYDRALPRQVSSAATLEYFTRHLSDAERSALRLDAERIFAKQPAPEALAQFPEVAQAGCAVDPGRIPLRARGITGRRELANTAAGVARTHPRRGGCRGAGTRRTADRGAAALAAQGCAPQFDSDSRHGRAIHGAPREPRRCGRGAARRRARLRMSTLCGHGSRSSAASPTPCCGSISPRCPPI